MSEPVKIDLDNPARQISGESLGISEALGVRPVPVSTSQPIQGKPGIEVEPPPSSAPASVSTGAEKSSEAEQPAAETVNPTEGEASKETPKPDADPDDDTPVNEETPVPVITRKVLETLAKMDLNLNQICIYSYKNSQLIFDVLKKIYPDKESREAADKDPASFYRILRNAATNGWGTTTPSYRETLETEYGDQHHKPKDFLVSQSDKSLGSIGNKSSHKFSAKTVDLTGQEARDAFMTKINGVLKVPLLNSGFWVTINRPQIHELQDIYDSVDLEGREFGYAIGPHYALIADIYLKKRFVDSLIKYRIIRDSNLVNIYKGNTFAQALSFHDYDVLLHAVLTLMSRSGMRVRVACPHCAKVDIVEDVDISSAKFVNRDLLTPEMTAWWDQKVDENGNPIRRTLADLAKYRNEILNFKYSYVEDFGSGKIRMTFKVPTMQEYFDIGEKLASKIRDAINEKAGEDEDVRRQALIANVVAHLLHMISPWVQQIESLGANDEVEFRTSDTEAILQTFDIATQELREDASQTPLDELMKFLAASKISYIGTTALECPHCHAKPDVGLGEFFPLEVQTTFFGQLYRLLPQELTQMVNTEA